MICPWANSFRSRHCIGLGEAVKLATDLHVPRHVRVRDERSGQEEIQRLSAWRSAAAYVLLADPGAGKSESFMQEAEQTGARYVTAREFALAQPPKDGCTDTWFIDGLDEMRAGAAGRDEPLLRIRRNLEALGRPRFRISCREADWIGVVDALAFQDVSPDGKLQELRLEPLDEQEIRQMLAQWPEQVPDVQAFWQQAMDQQLTDLLGNPLVLELIVAASRDGRLPASRTQTYQLACEQLSSEQNPTHKALRRGRVPDRATLLREAGLFCAVLLLSGQQAWSYATEGLLATDEIAVEAILPDLDVEHEGWVLGSKLFTALGDRRSPRHRSIAEFLAAQVIASLVMTKGLPMGRVLALMTGPDGGIVEPLRGLHAWLAAVCSEDRATLLKADPLGVVLYGDVAQLPTSDKRQLLTSLKAQAERFPWFRNGVWMTHPLGALASRDMLDDFDEALRLGSLDRGRQAFMDCVLDALCHAPTRFPELLPRLEALIEEPRFDETVRSDALRAWFLHSEGHDARALAWLEQVRTGQLQDPRLVLTALLLQHLYPQWLSAAQVMSHLQPADRAAHSYHHFWHEQLIQQTPLSARSVLADHLPALRVRVGQGADSEEVPAIAVDYQLPAIVAKIVAAALAAQGAQAPVAQVHAWLSAGLGDHGFSAFKGREGEGVRDWLSAHPDVMKAVVRYAWDRLPVDPQTHRRYFWEAQELLHHARLPADWYQWMLDQAKLTTDPELAAHCVSMAAQAAVQPEPQYNIDLGRIEHFLEQTQTQWPQASDWLAGITWLPLDHYQARQFRRDADYRSERLLKRAQRREALLPYLSSLKTGQALPALMHQLAGAYQKRFSDITGESPEARLQDFLGGSGEEVAAAIEGIKATLHRADLPTVEEILQLDLQGREHYIRSPCLLGAALLVEEDPGATATWSDELVARLVAFYLTDGLGETPSWFLAVAEQRPQVVAPVYRSFGVQRLKRHSQKGITSLWMFGKEARLAALAKLTVPALLAAVPARATEAQVQILRSELVPAARLHMPSTELAGFVAARLELPSLDAGQRILWMCLALELGLGDFKPPLTAFVGRSQTRAKQLVQALEYISARGWPVCEVEAVIRLLGPQSKPDWLEGDGLVRDVDRARDLVRGLINALSAQVVAEAGAALMRLRKEPALASWHPTIAYALFEHLRLARAAHYTHPSPLATMRTLTSSIPANVRDLQALVVAHLRGLEQYIRGEADTALLYFRRDDGRTPRVENECRDRLLTLLRGRLDRLQVSLEKEHAKAFDARSDLAAVAWIAGQRTLVPVEIKLEHHRQLWTACSDQLDRLYTIDPAAKGMGIYLVLWFGVTPRSRPPKHEKPSSAAQLEGWLVERVPESDRDRLAVVVLDLSLPATFADAAAR